MPRVTLDNIRAARKLRERAELKSWDDADDALERLAVCFPDNCKRADVLAKAAAIDKLYSTREANIYWVANAVVLVMQKVKAGEFVPVDAADVVNAISREKKVSHTKARYCPSFASKYCHFFVNDWVFPIYDSYADMAVRNLYGRVKPGQITRDASPYREFCERVELLRKRDDLEAVDVREMDRYLWIWGQHLAQRGNDVQVVNEGVFLLFRSKDPDVRALLEDIQPAS